MRGYYLLAGMLLALLLAGCSHQNPIVGTWQGTQAIPGGVSVNQTWQFTSDGKISTSMIGANGPRRGEEVSTAGVYTLNGSTMTQTIQTMSEHGRTVAATHPVPTTYQYTITGDQLKISGGGMPSDLTMTRQASP